MLWFSSPSSAGHRNIRDIIGSNCKERKKIMRNLPPISQHIHITRARHVAYYCGRRKDEHTSDVLCFVFLSLNQLDIEIYVI